MIIYKEFTFDAAHYLPNVPEGHKCRNMHGHTYHVKIFIKGELLPGTDWVMDFGELKKIVGPVIGQLDHHVLNDIAGLENPTAERLAQWIWKHISLAISGLAKIELQETPTSGVIYEG